MQQTWSLCALEARCLWYTCDCSYYWLVFKQYRNRSIRDNISFINQRWEGVEPLIFCTQTVEVSFWLACIIIYNLYGLQLASRTKMYHVCLKLGSQSQSHLGIDWVWSAWIPRLLMWCSIGNRLEQVGNVTQYELASS